LNAFDDVWTTASQAAVIVIAAVVGIAALYLARSIVMPVMAALVIGVTMRPVQKFAETYKIPPLITAALLVAAFSALLYAVVLLTVGPIQDWIAHTPELGDNIKEKLRWFERPLAALRELQTALGISSEGGQKLSVEASVATILQHAISIATPAITEFLVFLGTLLFFLVGTDKLRRQLITFFDTRDARLRVVRIWSDVEQNLMIYVATVTVINVCLGAATTAMLTLIGFPSPLTFGVLTFILNYIPYLGPAMMAATLFGVGLVALPSFGAAMLAPLLFVAMTTIEGHFITPSVIGRRLTLSPFLVFLALVFWTWLWGAFGTFLATPLLIVGLVLLGHLFPKDEVELPE
jgi:predicted PurR-regulated permease PerM